MVHKIIIDERNRIPWNLSCSTPYNKSESKNKNKASMKNGNKIIPKSPIIIDSQKGIKRTESNKRIIKTIL